MGPKVKKFMYMMTSLLLNQGSRLNSDFKLLLRKKISVVNNFFQMSLFIEYFEQQFFNTCLAPLKIMKISLPKAKK